ncbi:hypothetical protein BDV93DRAFT_516152 [Ceratobasidium sp. AG-I]|nr:hypothetical protein BDV93DRAFT_516152 [Ceratobasidium sp. AG-I]
MSLQSAAPPRVTTNLFKRLAAPNASRNHFTPNNAFLCEGGLKDFETRSSSSANPSFPQNPQHKRNLMNNHPSPANTSGSAHEPSANTTGMDDASRFFSVIRHRGFSGDLAGSHIVCCTQAAMWLVWMVLRDRSQGVTKVSKRGAQIPFGAGSTLNMTFWGDYDHVPPG